MRKYQSTGEAGVKAPLSEKVYETKVTKVGATDIIRRYCRFYECEKPLLVVTPKNTRVWGTYRRSLKRIRLNRPVLGVLLHELAHHVHRELFDVPAGIWHNRYFYQVLQDMHNMWKRGEI